MVAETEQGLQKIMSALEDTSKTYGMKINTKKTKVMIVSRNKGKQAQIVVGGQVIEQVDKFKYLGVWITEDGKCELEIKTRIALAKDAFTKRRELMTKGLNRETKKRIIKSLVWSVALYGSETWTLRKEEKRRIDALEMWLWRRMERISWTDRVRNEDVLLRVGEKRMMLEKIVLRQKNWIGHVLRGDGMLRDEIEGKMEGKRGRGRPRIGMLDVLLDKGSYWEMKRKSQDRTSWRLRMPRTCRETEH